MQQIQILLLKIHAIPSDCNIKMLIFRMQSKHYTKGDL